MFRLGSHVSKDYEINVFDVEKINKKTKKTGVYKSNVRAGKMAQWCYNTCCSYGGPVLGLQHPHWRLTSTGNAKSREFSAPFWSPQSPALMYIPIHRYTSAHISK